MERAGEFASRIGSLRPGDPNLRKALYTAIGLIVALGLGLAVFAALREFPDFEWRFEPAWMVAGVLGFAGVTLMGAELWRRLLLALGPQLKPAAGMTIWCASALGRYVPTSLLLPVMRMAMAEREGVPKRICLASLVYELMFGFTAALVVGAYYVIDLPSLQDVPERFLVLGLPAIAIVTLHPRVFHRFANGVLSRLGRRELPLALSEKRVLAFLTGYTAFYVLAGACVYALAKAVYPIGSDDLVIIVAGFAASTAISLVAFIFPSGLLAREAAFVAALSTAMPTAPAVGVAVLVRVVQIGVEVVLAVGVPLSVRLRAPRRGAPMAATE